MRWRRQQQVAGHQPTAVDQQLGRSVGVLDAVGVVVGDEQRARATVREDARQIGRVGMQQHHVGLRRRLGQRVQETGIFLRRKMVEI